MGIFVQPNDNQMKELLHAVVEVGKNIKNAVLAKTKDDKRKLLPA